MTSAVSISYEVAAIWYTLQPLSKPYPKGVKNRDEVNKMN